MIDLEVKQTTRAQLDRLMRPRSIALIGISARPGSLGECVLTNLEEARYSGELYLVNPNRPIIHKRTCLGTIEELPAGVDCAVLAIPGSAVVECASMRSKRSRKHDRLFSRICGSRRGWAQCAA
jgi:acetate---CoA ligase (ADP-forming)